MRLLGHYLGYVGKNINIVDESCTAALVKGCEIQWNKDAVFTWHDPESPVVENLDSCNINAAFPTPSTSETDALDLDLNSIRLICSACMSLVSSLDVTGLCAMCRNPQLLMSANTDIANLSAEDRNLDVSNRHDTSADLFSEYLNFDGDATYRPASLTENVCDLGISLSAGDAIISFEDSAIISVEDETITSSGTSNKTSDPLGQLHRISTSTSFALNNENHIEFQSTSARPMAKALENKPMEFPHDTIDPSILGVTRGTKPSESETIFESGATFGSITSGPDTEAARPTSSETCNLGPASSHSESVATSSLSELDLELRRSLFSDSHCNVCGMPIPAQGHGYSQGRTILKLCDSCIKQLDNAAAIPDQTNISNFTGHQGPLKPSREKEIWFSSSPQGTQERIQGFSCRRSNGSHAGTDSLSYSPGLPSSSDSPVYFPPAAESLPSEADSTAPTPGTAKRKTYPFEHHLWEGRCRYCRKHFFHGPSLQRHERWSCVRPGFIRSGKPRSNTTAPEKLLI